MKVFIASLGTGTNSFSPIPTGFAAFSEACLYHGDGSSQQPVYFLPVMALWRRLAEEDGCTVTESLSAFAQPGGPTSRRVYESFRAEILADLARAGPVDCVLLALHGAMIADGYEDCEGDLISAIRDRVGARTAIGVVLDLHCHLTRRMVSAATVIVAFKEYPHTDVLDRAREVYGLAGDAAAGKTRPVMAFAELPVNGFWRTRTEPVSGLVRALSEHEADPNVLSVSFIHGFPYGDATEAGAKMLVVTDDDAPKAGAVAAALRDRAWRLRSASAPGAVSMAVAVSAVQEAAKTPLVLADVADNPGGGAAGDSTFILRALLDCGARDVALGPLWDPVAVRFCLEAGEGARLALRLGGKCGPASGRPVDCVAEIVATARRASQAGHGFDVPMGDAALVRIGGIRIVLTELRVQAFSRDLFTQFGVAPDAVRAVVVKSMEHFATDYGTLGGDILYVDTPGALSQDLAALPYQRRSRAYWPRIAKP